MPTEKFGANGLKRLLEQLEVIKDSIKDETLAAHQRNMERGYAMTKVLLDAFFSSTKPEAASPARPGKGVGEALAVTPFESYELDYMNPPDLEEWFQREGVLSVEDEIKRAKEHSCFAVFLSKEILEAEEDWVFGGDDAYADLETFMYYVREWKARNED